MPRIPAPRDALPTMRTDEFTKSIYRIISDRLSELEKSRLPPRPMRARYFAANARTLAALTAIVERLFEMERPRAHGYEPKTTIDPSNAKEELIRRLDEQLARQQAADLALAALRQTRRD